MSNETAERPRYYICHGADGSGERCPTFDDERLRKQQPSLMGDLAFSSCNCGCRIVSGPTWSMNAAWIRSDLRQDLWEPFPPGWAVEAWPFAAARRKVK